MPFMRSGSKPEDIQKIIEDGRIDLIFQAGARIQLVLDLDSAHPLVRSSLILETDHIKNQILIHQTSPAVVPDNTYKSADLTMLLEGELNQKFRYGVKCQLVDFIDNYKLVGQEPVTAVLLQYTPPMREINVRTAFRLQLKGGRYQIAAGLSIDQTTFKSGNDFKVYDVSLTGMGLLVPRHISRKHNKMLDVELGDELDLELDLHTGDRSNVHRIIARIQVVRKLLHFNRLSGFIGARFLDLTRQTEQKLSKFIHDAQMYEIRNRRW